MCDSLITNKSQFFSIDHLFVPLNGDNFLFIHPELAIESEKSYWKNSSYLIQIWFLVCVMVWI